MTKKGRTLKQGGDFIEDGVISHPTNKSPMI